MALRFMGVLGILIIALTATAQVKNDRIRYGLKGAVKSVRVEEAKVSTKFGKPVEEKRELQEMAEFDEAGNKRKLEVGDGTLYSLYRRYTTSFKFVRGEDGHLEEMGYDEGGTLKCKTTFMFDSRGNVNEETVYELERDSFVIYQKTVFSFDGLNRLKESVVYNSKGAIERRFNYTYAGNLVTETETYGESARYTDSTGAKEIQTLDTKGNVIAFSRILTYEKSKPKDKDPAKFRNTYEFDSKGNWTKKTSSHLVTTQGPPFFEITSITYRTITYF